MPTVTGLFHSNGSPAVSISVGGPFPQFAQQFDAIIDTGFTGFLSMAWDKAFPLGLALIGTTNVILANGQTAPKLMTIATVGLGGVLRTGVALLAPAGDILVGMEFLKEFGKELVVSPGQNLVELRDDPPPPAVASAPQGPTP
jgi:predicted aspartyl protease